MRCSEDYTIPSLLAALALILAAFASKLSADFVRSSRMRCGICRTFDRARAELDEDPTAQLAQLRH
jgi:hypothetical protein